MARPRPPSAAEFRNGAQRRNEERGEEWTARLAEIARKLLPRMLSGSVVRAVREGRVGDAVEAVRLPSRKGVERLLQEVYLSAWQAGVREADDAIAALVEATEGQEFDEPFPPVPGPDVDLGELHSRRGEARIDALFGKRPELSPEMRAHIKREARQAVRSIRAEVRENVRQAAQAGGVEGQLQEAEAILAKLRKGDPVVGRRAAERAQTTILEADWDGAQTGARERYRVEPREIMLEFVSRRDDRVTPACQWFDGELLARDDPRVQHYTPQIHYNCRSVWMPVFRPASEESWDTVRAKTIWEPFQSARNAQSRSYRGKVSSIGVPSGGAVGPPRHLRDWSGYGQPDPDKAREQNRARRRARRG